MKRIMVFLCIAATILCLCACTVSMPAKKPSDGLWYCDELKISVDFGVYQARKTAQCAQIHNDDGSTTGILFRTGSGNKMTLVSVDQKNAYLKGEYSYKDDKFTVVTHSDRKKYVFVRIGDSVGRTETLEEVPTEGVWYCEDLKISVDFGLYIPECMQLPAKYHNGDGRTMAILYELDENGETIFFSTDADITYVVGWLYYENDTVTIVAHEDGREYTFVRVDSKTKIAQTNY